MLFDKRGNKLNIHMLFTSIITDSSLTNAAYYNLEKFNDKKINQLLTTLCSLKAVPFDSVDFYLAYDENNRAYKPRVNEVISNYFADRTYKVYDYRLETFEHWKTANDRIPSQCTSILLMSNLDHAFIAESTDEFIRFVEALELEDANSIGSITHWPEYATTIGMRRCNTAKTPFLSYNWTTKPIGTCIVSKKFFETWWTRDFTEGKRIVRPDNPFGPSVKFDWAKNFVPQVELFRHLDGYGHLGIKSKYSAPLRACCQISGDFAITHVPWVRGFKRNNGKADLPSISHKYISENLANLNSFCFSIFRTKDFLNARGVIGFRNQIAQIVDLVKIDPTFYKSILRSWMTIKWNMWRIRYLLISLKRRKIKGKKNL